MFQASAILAAISAAVGLPFYLAMRWKFPPERRGWAFAVAAVPASLMFSWGMFSLLAVKYL